MKISSRSLTLLTRRDQCLCLMLAVVLAVSAVAQSVSIVRPLIHGSEGTWPEAHLTLGSDGRLYGATEYGGLYRDGTLFTVARDGTDFAVLRSLAASDPASGANPAQALLEASDGRLYGVTTLGGAYGHGTLFRVARDGSDFTVLHHFDGSSGAAVPTSALIEGSDGRLYGATFRTEVAGETGAIFALQRDGSGFTVLHRFSAMEGRSPTGLIEGTDGRLYGTALYGGAHDDGTIFVLDRSGSGFAVLHSFKQDVDGHLPFEGLLEASNGRLYGTTQQGGAHDGGTVFWINRDGSGFGWRDLDPVSDAGLPTGILQEGADGRLYGTARVGGTSGYGAVFALTPAGSGLTILHSFDTEDGRYPTASLVQDGNGTLYGVTLAGGTYDLGTLFALQPDGSRFRVVRHLSLGLSATGTTPRAGLVEGPGGRLYGTATSGGAFDQGTVFSVTRDGADFATLRHLNRVDGTYPAVPLLAGPGDRLFGVAWYGEHNYGTLFSLNADGTHFAALHRFARESDGAYPWSLTNGGDGRLYGVARIGGAYDQGTFFSLNPDGSGFTVLRHFEETTDGAHPTTALLHGSDGRFYGVLDRGGDCGGLAFAVNSDGSAFAELACLGSVSVGSPLIEGSDGRLYGASQTGGVFGDGWLFALERDGSDLVALHDFDLFAGTGGGPAGGVIEGPDGRLYGTATNGAPPGFASSLFAINRDGSGFEVLHTFDPTAEGSHPTGALLAAADGRLYGTLSEEGPYGAGAIFAVTFPVRIASQPAGMETGIGGTATFSVEARGSHPIAYQWFHDGAPIPRATAATLVLTDLRGRDAGGYHVVVTNALGSVTSAEARLSVSRDAPVILRQPRSQASRAGRQALFSVKARSHSPLTYQWQKDGADIPRARARKLHLKKLTPADAGVYRVVVRNAQGITVSENATLTVE